MKDYIFKTIDNKLNLKASIYPHKTTESKGVILYFHGGGLIYGHRNDLPKFHIDRLNDSGYSIISFDYRLAPEAQFHLIIEDVLDAIKHFIKNKDKLGFSNCPYFLWGRSAGAYLSLLASTEDLTLKPKGIISYYGYGFILPSWYNTSSIHYLKYPKMNKERIMEIIKDEFIASGDIEDRFPLYLFGRQTGQWISMIFEEDNHKFLSKYSLANISSIPDFPPTFLAHSFKDNDVPFGESIELSRLITHCTVFTCSAEDHDFDRHETSIDTINLLNKTIDFLDSLTK